VSAVHLPARVVTPGPSSAAVVTLALHEGRRMTLHPFTLAGAAWGTVVFALLHDNGTRDAFDVVTSAVTFFLGVPVFFAANLVATRDRRARSGELLAGSPVPERARVVALLLGSLLPAVAAVGLVLAGHAFQLARGTYLIEPGLWHLSAGPVTVLGGALLGVMAARWLPLPGAAALVMVAMIAWNVVADTGSDRRKPLGTYLSWARWDSGPDFVGFVPGSPSLHVAYLLGLCAMAACGALLPGAVSRVRVLAVGAVLTAITAVLAAAQLP
jgi:hypothetical protein